MKNVGIACFVFVVCLAAYARTLLPGVVGGDAGELQYAAPLWSLVHPTGQPLYVSLGWLWTHLFPFGSMAWKMNLLSAVSAAGGAAALAYLFARLTDNAIVGAVGGLMLGFGATIWGQAVLPDKYGFNVLLAALLCGMTLLWSQAEQRRNQPQADRSLIALSVIFALCVLHHRSLMLFAISIGLMVVYYRRLDLLRRPRLTLLCAAIVLLPALIGYGVLLPAMRARDLSPLLWQPNSPADWIDFLLERHVLTNEALVFDNWENITRQVSLYTDTLLRDYTVLSVPLALIGFLALLRRDRVGGLFLLLNYLVQAFLSANWRGNDRPFTYYLPSLVLWVYAVSFGLDACWRWIRARWLNSNTDDIDGVPTRAISNHSVAVLVLSLCALILPILQFATAYPLHRQNVIYGERLDLWRTTLKSADMGARLTAGMPDLPPSAALAADWEQVTMLWYQQRVEGVRPDVQIFYPIERYSDYTNTDTPICLARHVPVGEEWRPTNIGALICLNREPLFDLPDTITPLDTTLANQAGEAQIGLAGYRIGTTSTPAARFIPLMLYWRALVDLDADYSISLQLLTESWLPAAPPLDIAHPVMGMSPTSRWVEGEISGDYHEIDVPPGTPPGRYLVTVVVYRTLTDGTFEQLRDTNGNVTLLVTTLEVVP